ncbi:AraC family transcriptional regulator [Terasakiispira papahanaumokuakeensis]|uniref:AraC family transcriptional regulator n=1 Tax=Terasakiispira papahanaumokuakeensis TaxID=197479 RepID=A0A1E2VCA6_9GAMM|nr:AraC family transcriptional regulator [Terasakiispira papahanaumokuakeensis]ODC04627.1 AraC family transcriptional regulator [Terasakiispira papahanaumokuakeensis]
MSNHLSIRAYSRQRHGHTHTFHQLVLPLRGVIEIELMGYTGKVAPGECVVIPRGVMHHFTANEEARFVVADMETLPQHLEVAASPVLSISRPLERYLVFIEAQLEHQVNPALEAAMFETFSRLLAEQRWQPQVDPRIRQVLMYIDEHLMDKLSLPDLAQIAFLSETQLKKLFRVQLGMTLMQYITQLRMEKARALLQHTDYAVQRVAELVGYTDVSAFSRRFSQHFGLTPRQFSH